MQRSLRGHKHPSIFSISKQNEYYFLIYFLKMSLRNSRLVRPYMKRTLYILILEQTLFFRHSENIRRGNSCIVKFHFFLFQFGIFQKLGAGMKELSESFPISQFKMTYKTWFPFFCHLKFCSRALLVLVITW